MDFESFLESNETSQALLNSVQAIIEDTGEATMRTTKSQIAFRRKRNFAWLWIPAQYLKRAGLAPLVLTLTLSYRDLSPRWKEIVEPSPGKFTHHLELWDLREVDAEVETWLRKAWEQAA
jgi:hypothetical protein